MLLRIENTYLAILRIVVLVAATVALLVAVFAFISSLPAISRQLGLTTAPAPVGGTLGAYIAAKKATIPSKENGHTPADPSSTRTVNEDVKAIAKIIQSYTRGAEAMTIPKWEQEIESSANDLPFEMHTIYFVDLRGLAEQLQRSKGKRLTVAQVRELMEWNKATFVEDARTKAAEEEAAAARAAYRLYIAGGAFVLFILVVFTFLFVKVERSLRLVRTVREEASNA